MEQVLLFRAGEESYGLAVSQVQEIVDAPPLYYIPRAPVYLRGAVNFHGAILPVLDLPAYLGLGDGELDPRAIVLTPECGSLALSVTALGRIVSYEAETCLPFPQERQETCYIRGVLSRDGEMINLLDAARLLASLEKA